MNPPVSIRWLLLSGRNGIAILIVFRSHSHEKDLFWLTRSSHFAVITRSVSALAAGPVAPLPT